ncbi:hypothetical protein BLNAU_24737 [Blattamonas nauphoetae]|uniref:Uncharacterized protein n=1 Tax=Blattamonas nauphoetae TaxID=2049346 RepID=A0ABQ9WLL4_9EUKA|nr:hypothetical protein BLNAU_24737 [Blattamonas nauphoetae]
MFPIASNLIQILSLHASSWIAPVGCSSALEISPSDQSSIPRSTSALRPSAEPATPSSHSLRLHRSPPISNRRLQEMNAQRVDLVCGVHSEEQQNRLEACVVQAVWDEVEGEEVMNGCGARSFAFRRPC